MRAEYGDDFDAKAPIKLLDRWQYGVRETAGAQVVVLSQVRGHPCCDALHSLCDAYASCMCMCIWTLPPLSQVLAHVNTIGYEHHVNQIVLTCNGAPIQSLQHLVRCCVDAQSDPGHTPFLSFALEPHDEMIVLETAPLAEMTRELLESHQIPHDRSADLRASSGASHSAAAESARPSASRARRKGKEL